MRTKQLKNKPSYGFEVKKMNSNTYALRRKVIDCIYALKKHVDLPRIEVRIVSHSDYTNICGYAYLNTNIVHIREDYANASNEVLMHLVGHEIVHATVGFMHDENCYLMCPNIDTYNPKTNEKTIEVFKTYFNR